MGPLIPLAATLLAIASASATGAGSAPASPSPAVRYAGASQTVIVRARIIRASARVGPGLGPPAPRMVARHTTVSAADGRAVPALVYDFE